MNVLDSAKDNELLTKSQIVEQSLCRTLDELRTLLLIINNTTFYCATPLGAYITCPPHIEFMKGLIERLKAATIGLIERNNELVFS